MALPTNAVAPDAPTDSTAIDGLLGLGKDAQEIRAFIAALSPAGSTAYDTGWVGITLASGFSPGAGAPPQVRRVGKEVHVRGQVQRTTGSFPVGELVAGTVPAGFLPSRVWADTFSPLWPNPTIATPVAGGINPNGNLVLRIPTTIATATSVHLKPIGPYLVD